LSPQQAWPESQHAEPVVQQSVGAAFAATSQQACGGSQQAAPPAQQSVLTTSPQQALPDAQQADPGKQQSVFAVPVKDQPAAVMPAAATAAKRTFANMDSLRWVIEK
jgi:hypothetical protein